MGQTKLKLMADYQCFPLWNSDGNIDPAQLPISNELRIRLIEWQTVYDETLNQEDPLNSGFKSDQDALTFEREGLQLQQMLSEQLCDDFLISYYSELKGAEIFL